MNNWRSMIRSLFDTDEESNIVNKEADDEIDDNLSQGDVVAVFSKLEWLVPRKSHSMMDEWTDPIPIYDRDELRDIIVGDKTAIEVEKGDGVVGQYNINSSVIGSSIDRCHIWYDRSDQETKQVVDEAFREQECRELEDKLETKRSQIEELEEKIDDLGCDRG